MAKPTQPDVAGAPERLTIPVNLAIDSIAFVDWVRTTIPGIVGGSQAKPPERFEVIELGLLSLYNYIMQRIAAELSEQGEGAGPQEDKSDGQSSGPSVP